MTHPLVSVVLPVRNGEAFLEPALNSICSQTLKDFELIVIDDGSTDRTSAILATWKNHDARLRVFRQDQKGLTAALNLGISVARGKYFARMDADDVCEVDRLDAQVAALDANPTIAAVGGAVQVIDAAGRPEKVLRFPTTHEQIRTRLFQGECPLCHPATTIRIDTLRAVGGYRDVVLAAEDYDLWLRIAERAHLSNLGKVVLKYRRHSQQVSIQSVMQQALSTLAARIAALRRLSGQSDILEDIGTITESSLTAIGVSVTMLDEVIVRAYLSAISSMLQTGDPAYVDRLVTELLSSPHWQNAQRPEVVDLQLLFCQRDFRRSHFISALKHLACAVASRPIILFRPLKPVLHNWGLRFRFDKTIEILRLRALGWRTKQ